MESAHELLRGAKMQIIAQLNADLAEARRIIGTLLRLTGARAYCARCGERVVFLRYAKNGDIMPHNQDGTAHHGTCPGQFTEEASHAR